MATTEETKKWLVIYPAYIDSTKTVAQGRCIPKNIAVEKPTLAEITSSLRKLGLLLLEEPDKCFSRDPVMEVGRVRVQLKNGETPVNPEIPNRTYLIHSLISLSSVDED